MDLGISQRLEPVRQAVIDFIANEVKPVEREFIEEIGKQDRWQFTSRQTEIMQDLKAKARAQATADLAEAPEAETA